MKRAYILIALSLLTLGLFLAMTSDDPSSAEGDENDFTINYGDYSIRYHPSHADMVIAVGYSGKPVNVDMPGEVEHDGITYMVGGMRETFSGCKTLETFRGGYGQDWFDIDAFSFYGCTSLETLEFGPALRYIHDFALLECTSLEAYILPEGSSWNTVFVEDGVLMLYPNAIIDGITLFKYPANKPGAEYHIPDVVDVVLSRSFDYAFNLEKVYIHENVKEIGTGAFHGCVALEAFVVDEGNPNFEVLDGVLYHKGLEKLLSYPAGITASTFDMPDSVTDVMDQAFFGNLYLEEVEFSANLEYVGFEAFTLSESLKRVVLPEGTQIIGENCFTLSTELEYVSIPSSMLQLGSYLFRGCTDLTTVYNASDVPLKSMHFVESTRTFTYYKDAAHTVQHDDPKEMYGDVYLLQGVPGEPRDHPVYEVIGVSAIVVVMALLIARYKD